MKQQVRKKTESVQLMQLIIIRVGRAQAILNKPSTKWSVYFYRLCTMRLMFLRATYCSSGSAESRVTSGGASFFNKVP